MAKLFGRAVHHGETFGRDSFADASRTAASLYARQAVGQLAAVLP